MATPPTGTPRRRRWMLFALAAAVPLLALVLAVLFMLQPVRVWVLESVLRRATGAQVSLEGIVLARNPAGVERVAVRDTEGEDPCALVEGLRVAHRWNPFSARPLRSVHAEVLHVHFLGKDPESTNYDFLLRRLDAPSEGSGSLTALPESLRLDRLVLEVERPRWNLAMKGLAVDAHPTSLEQFDATLGGEEAWLQWQTPAGGGEVTGTIDLGARGTQEGYAVEGNIALTEVAELAFTGTMQKEGTAAFQVEVASATLHQAFWPQLLSDFLPIPVHFEAVSVEEARFSGTSKPSLQLESGNAKLKTMGLGLGETPEDGGGAEAGEAALTLAQEGETLRGTLNAAIPGLLNAEGSGELSTSGAAREVTVELRALDLQAPELLAWLTAKSPYPVQAARLAAEALQASGRWEEGKLARLSANGAMEFEALLVGETDQPWYTGPAAAKGTLDLNEVLSLESTLRLAAGEPLAVQLTRASPELAVQVQVPGWSRAELLENLPPRLDFLLERLPGLEQVSGPISVTGAADTFKTEAKLALGLRGFEAGLQAAVNGTVNTKAAPLFQGTIEGEGEGATVQAKLSYVSAEDFDVEAALAQVKLAQWVRGWSEASLPEGFDAQVSGSTTVAANATRFAIGLDNTLQELSYGTFSLPEGESATAQGSVTLSRDLRQLELSKLDLAFAEGLKGTIEAGKFALNPFTGSLELAGGEADLVWLGSLLKLPDLYGAGRFSGPVRIAEDAQIAAELTLEFDSLGYGSWVTPYGQQLDLAGAFGYDPASRGLSASALQAKLGEATRLSAAQFSLAPQVEGQPANLAAEQVELTTDLAPLVTMELLGGAEGMQAVFTLPHLRRENNVWNLQVQPRVEGAVLSLPKRLARLEESHFEGNYTFREGALGGAGTLRAARLIAGGATMHGIDTQVVATGQDLVLERLESVIFGGRVRGTASAGLLREGYPVSLDLELENIDLAVFTEEFKPPEIKMTGLANGTARVVFSSAGMQDFQAKLVATEHFTLNRDMLMLLAEYMEQNVTDNRQLQRVIEEVIGGMEQRPFERAELDLGFEDNLIIGVLRLQSKRLDFNINLTSDPESLITALQIRQEQPAPEQAPPQ